MDLTCTVDSTSLWHARQLVNGGRHDRQLSQEELARRIGALSGRPVTSHDPKVSFQEAFAKSMRDRGSLTAYYRLTVMPCGGTICAVIKTFRDKVSAATFTGLAAKSIPADIRKRARAKLQLIHAAAQLDDLRVPPGNRLEALEGDRLGQHSIRINDQWRVCFIWKDGDAYDVEICDYH